MIYGSTAPDRQIQERYLIMSVEHTIHAVLIRSTKAPVQSQQVYVQLDSAQLASLQAHLTALLYLTFYRTAPHRLVPCYGMTQRLVPASPP